MVALALGSLVCACVTMVIATQGRLLRAMIAQSADAEAARIVHGVLGADLRALTLPLDVRHAAGDSVAARLFRGVGVPCGRQGAALLVRFHGMRMPAVGKDSLLLVHAAGDAAAGLVAAETGACEGAEADNVVRLAGAAGTPAVVLVFESGTYYVRDRAFRYRLGAEGRQPVTDERFRSSSPPVSLDAAGGVLTVPVAWPHGRFSDTVRVRFANFR